MEASRTTHGRVGGLVSLLGLLVFFNACAAAPVVVVASPPVAMPSASDEDDFSQLVAQMRADLNRFNGRQVEKKPALVATAETRKQRDTEFSNRAKALFAPLQGASLQMPVVGVQPFDLYNSWHQARDGGRRKHKGIDIFAPKGTGIVAVSDGVVSFIGEQPKGGLCLWLTTENGTSFYYAHLDRWAPGLYEGMEVRSGDLLGYVGNTGNAKTTPPHLHFAVNDNDEMVNPYPILTRAIPVKRARVLLESGGAMGTR